MLTLSSNLYGCYTLMNTQYLSRSDAAASCHNRSSGWLATLDTSDKLAIPGLLGVSMDTYIGLYKTTGCTLTGCAGKLAWDTYGGISASTTGYTLNMDSGQPKTNSNLYFSIKFTTGTFSWQDSTGSFSLPYLVMMICYCEVY